MRALFKSSVVSAMLVATANVAFATPPDRPVSVEPADERAIPEMRVDRETFTVPLDLRLGREVPGVILQIEIWSTDPIAPQRLRGTRQTFEPLQQERISAEVPVIREPGVYKVEIAAGDTEGAIYDRVILFQIVDQNRSARLLTQQQWRDERVEQRRSRFEQEQTVRVFAAGLRPVFVEDMKGVQVAPGDPNALLVRPREGAGTDAAFVRDISKEAWRARDPITVRGRIVYTDFEGTVRTLINAGIYLYDDDTFGDEFLGSVVTDGNGDFSFSVNNDDGWLQDGRDVYVKLKLDNSRWQVKDGSSEYQWSTDVRDDLNDGAVVDFGTVTPDSDQEAAQIFAFMNRAWSHVVSAGGRDPGFVAVEYPGAADQFNGEVNLTAATNRAPDIAIHEYGHFLMAAAYPGGDPSPGGSHNFGESTQDRRLSWSEGWATGFMLSSCNDGQYNWDEGTSEGAGEWPTCTVQSDSGGQELELYSGVNRQGELQEARVAGALLDFIDAANDDNGGTENRGRNGESDSNAASRIGLSTLYDTVMWGSGHNDMLEYWRSLVGELSGPTLAGGVDIMQYNWMSEPVDIDLDCVASKVAAAELEDYVVTIEGLRAFRDEALKPLADGRRLIRMYYRHSPEIAVLLIRNPNALAAGTVIVRHFAAMGEAARSHQLLERMVAEDGPLIPPDVVGAANAIFALIDEEGSEELRTDAAIARQEMERVAPLRLSVAMRLAAAAPRADDADRPISVGQHDLAPASRRVDRALIRERLPDVARP